MEPKAYVSEGDAVDWLVGNVVQRTMCLGILGQV